MKQIFIFRTDKAITVMFFSVLHDVITYSSVMRSVQKTAFCRTEGIMYCLAWFLF